MKRNTWRVGVWRVAVVVAATIVLGVLLARRAPTVAVVYDAVDLDLVGSST
jgi:hypothetical protein